MIPRWYTIAVVFIVLVPVTLDLGLWLFLPEVNIAGNACLACFPSISIGFNTTNALGLTQEGIAVALFALGIIFFVSSLGLFASNDRVHAMKWLVWLGRLRPRLISQTLVVSAETSRYRRYTLISFLALFVQSILLIPGIGEDRQYSLGQFSTLAFVPSGALWYFYALAIEIAGFALIYFRRPGGFLLPIIVAAIGLGTSTTDMLGFLPPSAPTLRTDLVLLPGIPLLILMSYLSWKGFRSSLTL